MRPFAAPYPGALLELPHQHRIPLTWLLENAGASIRYRTLTELAPAGYATPEAHEAAHQAALDGFARNYGFVAKTEEIIAKLPPSPARSVGEGAR